MTDRPQFDEIIHAPNRLRICAVLATVADAEFRMLRDELGVADSVMSKHLKVLVDAGYVRLTKPLGASGRVRTWASLTPAGRKAFQAHVAELQRLATVAAGTADLRRARGVTPGGRARRGAWPAPHSA